MLMPQLCSHSSRQISSLSSAAGMSLASLFSLFCSWLAFLTGRRTIPSTQIGKDETVIIIGAGFAGVTLAHYLESTTAAHIILYDRKDFFEYTPAVLRCMREVEHCQISHSRLADLPLLQKPRIRIVQQEVTDIAQGAVRGKDGSWQKYDKLVLAMGSDYKCE
jgi:hypothetical protein